MAEASKTLTDPVPQGDAKASAEADLLKRQPRNFPVHNNVTVPKTDTGGWVEYTQARE